MAHSILCKNFAWLVCKYAQARPPPGGKCFRADSVSGWKRLGRKEIYEALHPETRLGQNQHTRVCQNGEPSDRFTADTAKKTGSSERAVQRDASRGARIDKEILSTIAGTDFDMGQNAAPWTGSNAVRQTA